eukprot:6195409-Pleurochrysis_carterae.AAC.5
MANLEDGAAVLPVQQTAKPSRFPAPTHTAKASIFCIASCTNPVIAVNSTRETVPPLPAPVDRLTASSCTPRLRRNSQQGF